MKTNIKRSDKEISDAVKKLILQRFKDEKEIISAVEETLSLTVKSIYKEDLIDKDNEDFIQADYSFLLDLDAKTEGEEYAMLTLFYCTDRLNQYVITEAIFGYE